MKTIILSLSLMIFSVSIFAQNYALVSNEVINNASSKSHYKPLSTFTVDVTSKATFRYREFLRTAKDSKATYKVGQEIYTKHELTQIIRIGARKSKNFARFVNYITYQNPAFSSYLSDSDMVFLYEKFKLRISNNYLNEIDSNFKM